MHYVMTDIHGDMDHFLAMLEQIRFEEHDKLYLLGDVIDRGRQNLEMLAFCRDYENIFLIKGNHEYFMEIAANDGRFEDQWRRFGGRSTLNQLYSISDFERAEFEDYVMSLPWTMVIDRDEVPELERPLLLTHTGFLNPYRYDDSPDFCFPDVSGEELFDVEAAVQYMVRHHTWSYSVSSDLYELPDSVRFDKRLLVGHVPTMSGHAFEPVPYIYEKREYIDLDCGCGYRRDGGKLACLRLEDFRVWYL